jgi:hypothetical protein
MVGSRIECQNHNPVGILLWDFLFCQDIPHELTAAFKFGCACRIGDVNIFRSHPHPAGEWAHLFRNAKRLYQALV